MKIPKFHLSLCITAIAFFSLEVFSHGLVQSPKSRNQACGVEIKPDQAAGTACEAAFVNDFTGGYQFMSVLTHDVGRAGVTPLPENVCGFNSETWQGGPSPWDSAIDWPTQPMTSGRQPFVWNIEWGPHFDDTEEFRYWITKPGFEFVIGQPLTWDDFESEEFCYQPYDDKNPGANPDVIPDKGATEFTTYCNVPARSGRHVIYAEWGRNFFTFERFHGCIDVEFGGSGPVNTAPQANSQSVQVQSGNSVGITLSGSDSDGSVVSYFIVTQPANGNLSGNAPNVTYTPDSGFSGSDDFAFIVTDNDGADSSPATVSVSVTASPSTPTPQPPTPTPTPTQTPINQAPTAVFTSSTNDLSVNLNASGSSDPDNDALSYSWNFGDGTAASGVSVSHTYTSAGSYPVVLTVSDGALSDSATQNVTVTQAPPTGGGLMCDYVISNAWNTGFVANIRLTNTGNQTVNGWTVSWAYSDGSSISNLWNANLSGSNPYTASNLGWNASIAPGQTVEFGFQGTLGGSNASIPAVTGELCQ